MPGLRVPFATGRCCTGSGHVELVTARGTFGALDAGTRNGWHIPNPLVATYFRVV